MKLARQLVVTLPLALAGVLVGGTAQAVPVVVTLFEYAFNIDGSVSDPTLGDPVPAEVNIGGFDTSTGLGTITATITGAGSHTFDAFFDHEIDDTINTFFNEYGVGGTGPAAGQSWEIDEPGYVFGDIYTNFENSTLDNTNAVPSGSPNDVSMALGWDFNLAVGETALFSLVLSDVAPTSGFYLTQTDPDSNYSIYLSSSMSIHGVGVPAPGVLSLLAIGLAGMGGVARLRKEGGSNQ